MACCRDALLPGLPPVHGRGQELPGSLRAPVRHDLCAPPSPSSGTMLPCAASREAHASSVHAQDTRPQWQNCTPPATKVSLSAQLLYGLCLTTLLTSGACRSQSWRVYQRTHHHRHADSLFVPRALSSRSGLQCGSSHQSLSSMVYRCLHALFFLSLPCVPDGMQGLAAAERADW